MFFKKIKKMFYLLISLPPPLSLPYDPHPPPLPYYLARSTHGVSGHEDDLDLSFFLDGKRKRKITEWIKLDGYFLTLRTDECRFEQAVKSVDYYRVVTPDVVLPHFFGYFLILIQTDNLEYK